MNLWVILSVNSVTFGGLLFLLSVGFALIFGLMRIPNLTHGSLFMLGAYFGVTLIAWGFGFWEAAVLAGLGVALFGAMVERFVLRRLVGAELAQVLVTLGLAFMIADTCLMLWGGDPISVVDAAARGGLHPHRRHRVPDLSAGHHSDRRRHRRGTLGVDRAHPARRAHPRRG